MRRITVPLPCLACLCTLALAFPAAAAVTTLSGGDPGEGFAPRYTTIAARDFFPNAGQVPLTVQTVTFPTNDTAITLPGGPSLGGTAPSLGASANDTAFSTVLKNIYYGGTMTTDVSGLTAGLPYQLDLLVATNGFGSRRMRVEFRDSSNAVLFSELPFIILSTNAYDISRTIVAPADGIIRVAAIGAPDATYTDPNAIVSALVVTLPEPASLSLLALGCLLVTRRPRGA